MSASDYEITELVERAQEIRNANKPSTNDLIRAQGLLRTALDLRVSASGRADTNAAYILNELGLTYELEGSLIRAKQAFKDALPIYEKNNEQTSVAVVLNNLARVQHDQRSFEDASDNRGRAVNVVVAHARSLETRVRDMQKSLSELEERVKVLEPKRKAGPAPDVALITPREVVAELDKRIIGQHAAKRKLGIAVSNHVAMMHLPPEERARIEKSNVILIGGSGTGKTTLMKKLRNVVPVPIYITQATDITEAGYVGGDVEDIIAKLLKYCDYDVAKAQFAIVYVDEIDKKATQGDSGGRDVSGKGVQKALLTMLEGTIVRVPGKDRKADWVDVDTSNILFIVGGAFEGLSEIVAHRIRKDRQTVGFGADFSVKSTACLHETDTTDLIQFGMIKEILVRLPVIAYLEDLDTEALTTILTEPEDSLVTQKQTLLSVAGKNVEFDEEALAEIATAAQENKTGGRGLRAIVEEILEPIMFEDRKGKVIVTAEMVRNRKVAITKLNEAAALAARAQKKVASSKRAKSSRNVEGESAAA